MPSNNRTIYGAAHQWSAPQYDNYDPNRRTTLHLTDEALDRIRTLEAQRDELLATLEAVCAAPGKDVTAWQRAEAAIRKAKGEA